MNEPPDMMLLDPADSSCPSRLCSAATIAHVSALHALGNLDILAGPLLGFFCSSRCPGGVILRAYDLARELRDSGISVISGFHAPIERECLRILLRGQQPIVVCAARSLVRLRIPSDWRQPLVDGRLLIISPITGQVHRPTAEHAATRNQFAAAVADSVLIAHAAPGSKIQRLSESVLARPQPLLTLDDLANHDLIAHGAQPITAATIAAWWGQRITQTGQ
jgi:predicted Rossmann fold nucleotide-binding protein DprA/Smf involved in DNA uptake